MFNMLWWFVTYVKLHKARIYKYVVIIILQNIKSYARPKTPKCACKLVEAI